jgi:hypothetical protein
VGARDGRHFAAGSPSSLKTTAQDAPGIAPTGWLDPQAVLIHIAPRATDQPQQQSRDCEAGNESN